MSYFLLDNSFDNDFIKNLAQKLQEKIVNKRKEGVTLSEVLKSSFLSSLCDDEEFGILLSLIN